MGGNECRESGFPARVIGELAQTTTAEDTKRAVRDFLKRGCEIIVVVGGDGTLRDVFDVVDTETPVLAVPAGVKMHSSAFFTNPEAAAEALMKFLWDELPLREAEVMDVDEEAFRKGRVSARLYGYVLVPYEPRTLQGSKIASTETEDEIDQQRAIARYVIELMEPGVYYFLGPGTTTRAITDLLGEEKSLLGVDAILDRKVVGRDLNEKQILKLLATGKRAKLVVSPIGGQGFIFGRGNQQFSPEVIKRVGPENVIVVATAHKLSTIRALRVDTGDPELDRRLKGHIRVISDYKQTRVVRVE
jgi:predicted polyphosphate/ATP-dependent NAD kinase